MSKNITYKCIECERVEIEKVSDNHSSVLLATIVGAAKQGDVIDGMNIICDSCYDKVIQNGMITEKIYVVRYEAKGVGE